MSKEGKEELEKDLQEFEGTLSIKVYQELLERSYEKISGLKAALATIHQTEVTLRDKIAAQVFGVMIVQSTSNEQAAQDSYKAADSLLRVRETGAAYDSDLLQILKEMRDSSKEDTVFGRTVRRFLSDK